MGLDAYAFSFEDNEELPDDEVDIKIPEELKAREEFYWRKHHDLHNWMENLYYNKGGSNSSFNCEKVRLLEEDLNNLEKDVLSKTLYRDDEYYFDSDVEFIVKAREAIKNNRAVYYDSWW
jgi:hypothetical protein